MSEKIFLFVSLIIFNIALISNQLTDTPIPALNKIADTQLCYTCCPHGTVNAGYTKTKRDDYYYKEGIGAYKLHTRKASWNEARKICHEEGAHLAIINSMAEAEQLRHIFNTTAGVENNNFVLIGFHDLYTNGDYVTIHDESLEKAGYDYWHPGQPDNYGGNESCGCIYKNGRLNDISCTNRYPFFCELAK